MNIAKLISVIISEKELRFTQADAQSRFSEFLESGQLFRDNITIAGKDISIRSTKVFLEAVHEYFSALYQFKLGNDIDELLDYIQKIELYFDGNYRYGINELSKSLTEYLLRLSITSFNADLTGYALTVSPNSWENKHVEYFNAYMTLLPELPLPFEKVWEVAKYFALDLGIPKPGSYDMRWAILTEKLTKIIKSGKHTVAVITQTIAPNRTDPGLALLVNAAYKALKDSGGFSMDELLSWLDDSSLRKNALEILPFSSVENAEEAEGIFNKLQTISITNEEEIFLLPRLYCHILEKTDEINSAKVNDRLQHFILGDEPTMVRITINALAMCDTSIKSFDECFSNLLESGKYLPDYNNNFNTLFIRHQELDSFISFMTNYAMTIPAAVAPTSFEAAIGLHKQKDRTAFEKAILMLMIHRNGLVRWFAHRIFFSVFQFSERASLEFDPLNLSRIDQYKMLIAFSVPFQRAHYTVPIIAILLKSQDDLISETALCKLEELIYSYKVDVLKELDLAIPDGHPKKKAWMDRLRECLNQLVTEISLKDSIKELNPQHAQAALFNAYIEIYSKKSSATLEDARKSRKGILQFAKNVSIARGGGWKIPGGEVQPLSEISFSWPMARTMFINSEAMDLEMKEFYQTDWEIEYKEWEQKIL